MVNEWLMMMVIIWLMMVNNGNIWGFQNWGYPNCWMVYFMETPTKMDYMGDTPVYGTPHIYTVYQT